jgi:hypothetical protein
LQRAWIEKETAEGSRKHNRLPRWTRWTPKYVVAFDFCLLLYFFTGIIGVNWASPLSLALTFAVLLTAMMTMMSYTFLDFIGSKLRSHKNHDGTIDLHDLARFTKSASGIAIVFIILLATLMFLRMRTETLYALGAQAQLIALTIAVAVAVVSAAANFLVIVVRALDGSDEVDRLEKLSAAIRRVTRADSAKGD